MQRRLTRAEFGALDEEGERIVQAFIELDEKLWNLRQAFIKQAEALSRATRESN